MKFKYLADDYTGTIFITAPIWQLPAVNLRLARLNFMPQVRTSVRIHWTGLRIRAKVHGLPRHTLRAYKLLVG